MYYWYERAKVCYAFFQWFTRGWTLQELLASQDVRLYSRSWKLIGTRTSPSTVISVVAKVNVSVLDDEKSLFYCSLAERMSWAAHRKTTRMGDRAYNAHATGEGEKAYIPLQEEIIRQSDDHSIVAWSLSLLGKDKGLGLLAPAPGASPTLQTFNVDRLGSQSPYTITNKGVPITLELMP
ncbi:hypothetical protein F4824DRAFT_486807 [Ustulina deusta]|nr:hypothetical protein F4824DRAFT_486807 [Ustulina deusta]